MLLLKQNQRHFHLEYRSSHDAVASGNGDYREELHYGCSEMLCCPALLLQPRGGMRPESISPPLPWTTYNP